MMERFNEYQEFVNGMKIYPEQYKIIYPVIKLAGEQGEVSEKVGKWLRGDKELNKEDVIKELGDIIWYIGAIVDDLGYTLQDVIDANVLKLTSRKERNVLHGSGDNR